MTRSELIRILAKQNPQLYIKEVEAVVTVIFDEISSALSKGQRVELRGFGTFFTKRRNARNARNPRTGTPVAVEEKRVPFFKSGKPLKIRMNPHLDSDELENEG